MAVVLRRGSWEIWQGQQPTWQRQSRLNLTSRKSPGCMESALIWDVRSMAAFARRADISHPPHNHDLSVHFLMPMISVEQLKLAGGVAPAGTALTSLNDARPRPQAPGGSPIPIGCALPISRKRLPIYPTGCAARGRSQERLSSNSALVLQAPVAIHISLRREVGEQQIEYE
jgi:hypothetical protein